jgi:hypothetical protein
MKVRYVLAAVAALAVAAPAVAGDKDSDQKVAQDAPKEKKICHNETVTGSLIAKRRICKTQREWDELAAATKQDLTRYTQRQGTGGETGSAAGSNNTAGFGF